MWLKLSTVLLVILLPASILARGKPTKNIVDEFTFWADGFYIFYEQKENESPGFLWLVEKFGPSCFEIGVEKTPLYKVSCTFKNTISADIPVESGSKKNILAILQDNSESIKIRSHVEIKTITLKKFPKSSKELFFFDKNKKLHSVSDYINNGCQRTELDMPVHLTEFAFSNHFIISEGDLITGTIILACTSKFFFGELTTPSKLYIPEKDILKFSGKSLEVSTTFPFVVKDDNNELATIYSQNVVFENADHLKNTYVFLFNTTDKSYRYKGFGDYAGDGQDFSANEGEICIKYDKSEALYFTHNNHGKTLKVFYYDKFHQLDFTNFGNEFSDKIIRLKCTGGTDYLEANTSKVVSKLSESEHFSIALNNHGFFIVVCRKTGELLWDGYNYNKSLVIEENMVRDTNSVVMGFLFVIGVLLVIIGIIYVKKKRATKDAST